MRRILPLSDLATSDLLHRCATIRDQLSQAGLFPALPGQDTASGPLTATTTWRIATEPFPLTKDQLDFFHQLGPQLLSFYRALNRLYLDSVRGLQPSWVAGYLDQGKPGSLLSFSRMKRFRDQLPAVIRPDIIPTQDGMVITELDSVPGGIGLTGALTEFYRAASPTPHLSEFVGGSKGMVLGFAAMLKAQLAQRSGCVAILLSEEAKDYRPEMTWLAAQLRGAGLDAYCIEPRHVRFTEEGLRITNEEMDRPIALIYRFYELFDLLNIPKSELLQYAIKKDLAAVTPPYKPALEEKLAFALLHHPALRPFWEQILGKETFLHLTTIMPRTWILDPAPIPPTATIPGLAIGGKAVMGWHDLSTATQKERHFVIKPSGFSELAWGSRGVSVGHDMPQIEWVAAIDKALASFPSTPYILQEFHKGRLYELDYFDPVTGEMNRMSGRARLSPYYFVSGEKTELAGILATICPADKKVIHGMKDAVMAPCAVTREQSESHQV
ncbi:MAG: hypothetical protein E8D46_11885 [Nitrospira sp.]|nr:hypothetical protein [Nitrospira sp.]TKB73145.1 MAG: hypothetical protein E8D46_11885 [Nitrospira sp.]